MAEWRGWVADGGYSRAQEGHSGLHPAQGPAIDSPVPTEEGRPRQRPRESIAWPGASRELAQVVEPTVGRSAEAGGRTFIGS